MIAAAARAIIRIHQLKIVHADDYFCLVATAALIAGAGLFYAFIGILYTVHAISEGKTIPPPNFVQEIEHAASQAQIAELLCWTTIFSIKFSFLFYFRALVNRLHKMEVWWWFTFAVFIPITAIIIPGPFIVCPHTGPSVLCRLSRLHTDSSTNIHVVYCSSNPGFLRREHGFLYFTVASDIVTDIMRRESKSW